MHYWELFREEVIVLDLQSKAKEAVLREMVDTLVEGEVLSRKEGTKAFELLKKREQAGSTGIGSGVAIPHVKVPGTKTFHAAFGIHRGGVEYRSIDGEPVHLIFLVLRPEEDAEEHLRFLQWIARLGRNADFRRFALRAKDAQEVLALLKEMSAS